MFFAKTGRSLTVAVLFLAGRSLTFAALFLTACSNKEAERKTEARPAPVSVTVRNVEMAALPEIVEASGTVRARVSATIAARMMAQVREVRVQAGDTVRAGQVLVVLDARDVESSERQAQQARGEAASALPEAESAIAAAQAQLELAQSTFKRMDDLHQKKSITEQEFDEASSRVRMAQANVQMARAKKAQVEARIRQADENIGQTAVQKTYTTLVAPFAGTVAERRAEAGVMAAPGVPLLVLDQAGGYRLEVGVEEALLAKIKAGTSAEVELDAGGSPIQTRVEEILPAIDAATRTFTAKLGLPALANVRAGLFGRARFRTGTHQALAVPLTAVREQGQMRSVFVVTGGVARSRLVTLGARFGEQAEVLSGLEANERIVSPLGANVTDGSPVEVRQ